ncbi:MAG: HipA domain-containing protein [Treponema sp.]|nr:HipA domain-containing protein [Treponema sp.]
MDYVLFHKEIPVLNFELDEDLYLTRINEIYNEKHAPIGILNNASESSANALRSWWKNRAIPASRQYLQETLDLLRIKTSEELLSKCHGLSLSDHYWVRNFTSREYNLKWKDINFFENNFSEDIGKILTGNFGIDDIGSISFLSPDGSTDGWLPKKWVIENRQRVLIKGGSETYQQEPFNEVLASKLCEALNINHVEYNLTKHTTEKGTFFYSACPDMIDVNTELVPAYSVFKTLRADNNTDSITLLFNACQKLGMKNIEQIKQNFSKIAVLDFMIANTDRHLNNFGFIRNPDTLEWLGIAPVYDSGTALFCKQSPADLKNPAKHDSEYIETKPFAKTLLKQFEKILKVCGRPDLNYSALTDIGKSFSDMLSQNPQNEGRSEILGHIIDSRIEETINILENSRQKRTYSAKRHTGISWTE